jgi:sulfopyruvate decarboxylase TPP-binding subunit
MTGSTTGEARPIQTVRALVRSGITHVVGIPDNTSGALFHEVVRHPTLRLVTVTREGEAFAIASGLWLGGASPLVVIQNTGLLESGDSLRGTALRMGASIPVLVTGRGYAAMHRAGLSPDADRTIDLLTRCDVDTTALFTEPTLDVWGVPFRLCGAEDDPVVAIEGLVAEAGATGRTIALVLTRSLT